MSRFKLIFAIILICIASTSCAIFEGRKKDDQSNCVPGNIMAAYFIDRSGTDPHALSVSFEIMSPYTKDYCNGFRFIIAGVSDEYVPWPKNVTAWQDAFSAQAWLESALQPYRGIFDLQTSVNTFFTLPQYSSYDPQSSRPPFAVIYAFSDTVNGINNLLNGISRLTSEGYTVLLIASQLTRYKVSQLLQVLPQSNIMSTDSPAYSSVWLTNRFDAGYTVPITNQTGTSGYITSPNYPNNYESADLREYYITAPSTYNAILLTIDDFDINWHSDTALFVYQGSIMDDDDYLYTWDRSITGKNFTIPSNAVTLRFFSDLSDAFKGFNISWTAISNPPEEKSDNSIG